MKSIILYTPEVERAIEHGTVLVVRPVKGMPVPFPESGLDRVCGVDRATSELVLEYQVTVDDTNEHRIRCPFGGPGESRWVQETRWCCGGYVADGPCRAKYTGKRSGKIPSCCVPRGDSRLTLKLLGVRVPQVQDISEADAMAAGSRPITGKLPRVVCGEEINLNCTARELLCVRWDARYAKRGFAWADNPYVWMGKFEVVT